jgi:diguanylate cyclase (GGDEF)-like protein
MESPEHPPRRFLDRYHGLRYVLPAVAAYLCLYGFVIRYTRAAHPDIDYALQLAAPWFAFACCVRSAALSPAPIRRAWIYAAIAIFLWAFGLSTDVFDELGPQDNVTIAHLSDFVFFMYGAPMLLVFSQGAEQRQLRLFDWLDSIQVLASASIVYLALFAVLPFEKGVSHPAPASFVESVYNVENLFLAASGTLRLFAHRQRGEARRLYSIICAYLWLYAGCAACYNHLVVAFQGDVGEYELLAAVPFLVLAVACLGSPADHPAGIGAPRSVLEIFIDNASPVLYTIALVFLGVAVVREHYWVGITGIVLALVAYAIRSTVLQTSFIRSQRELREAHDQLETLARTDVLTGVPNRRHFDLTLDAEWQRAASLRRPLCLLLIDVDHFKKLNDHYGHPAGDACLRDIAAALSSAVVRSTDLLFRYGGEEFAAILVNTDRSGAETVAARMRSAVRDRRIPHALSEQRIVTVSIGISIYEPPADGTKIFLVSAADTALYRAKTNGRDRVERAF